MADWRPDDPDDEPDEQDVWFGPELDAALLEKIGPVFARAFDSFVNDSLAALFPPAFLEVYTWFDTWDDLLSAARRAQEQRRLHPFVIPEGLRFPATVKQIRQHEIEGDEVEAVRLLVECCTYEESVTCRPHLARFHERLAIIYGKQGRIGDAIAVCERYVNLVDPTGGEMGGKMAERLARLRAQAARPKRR